VRPFNQKEPKAVWSWDH